METDSVAYREIAERGWYKNRCLHAHEKGNRVWINQTSYTVIWSLRESMGEIKKPIQSTIPHITGMVRTNASG